jgi:hypothetical protein
MNEKLVTEIQKIAKEQKINIVLTKKRNVTKKSLKEFKDFVDWYDISMYQRPSEDFIREFKDEVSWYDISMCQKLSEDFIKELKSKVNWYNISMCQKLSEDFIREFKSYLNWRNISVYQKLSEGFIREFKNEVDWYGISKYQKLSEDFIREFKNEINWYNASDYQKLSAKFRKELDVKQTPNNWLYKSTKKKLEYIRQNTKYKIIDDKYIIAYKAIRSDNYSAFNFQYKYEKGGIYESHCDCNMNVRNSFGLAAWTKRRAKEYYDRGKIIRVKIAIKDIGAIVHDDEKIRCFRFEVL